MTRDNPKSTPESDALEVSKSTTGQQTGGCHPREDKDVVMTDRQNEPESDGPPPKRCEILPGLALLDDQLAASLADEGVRAANGRAGKAMARDERDELPSIPRKSNGSSVSGAGPIQGAAMVAPASVKAASVKSIHSAPVALQSITTLPSAAKTRTEKSTPDNQSAGAKFEHYEEEDQINPVRTATKRTD